MYKSQIELLVTDIQNQIVKQQDEEIYKAVIHYVPNVDKEEVIRALNYDRQQYQKGYLDGKVDAVEVVHGRWVNAAGCRTICDHCGEYPLYDYWGRQKLSNYCPNCGKKMGSEPALSEGTPAGYCNRAVGDPSD